MNRQTSRGTIAFFATYRPPVPLDIFSSPLPPSSAGDELHLTDGFSYNYNGHPIPPAALKDLLSFLGERNRKVFSECGATLADVDAGRVTGLVFVSERSEGLETLHVALRFNMNNNIRVKVLGLDEIYGSGTFGGTRLEDSGCIAGGFKVGSRTVNHSLIYISAKEPVEKRRSPWTKVYRTNLRTGETECLTPSNQFDLSPAVSLSGKMVAVASYVGNAWRGEIENLKTNIYVMNVDRTAQGGLGRGTYPIIQNGGWPSWGSDNVIFFHRGADTMLPNGTIKTAWGVFRYDIITKQTIRVTPVGIDCITPAAINETHVALATIRNKSSFADIRTESQYRHIEIFDTAGRSMQVTQRIRPKADHYNPFVMNGGRRVGYHRCHNIVANEMPVARNFNKVQSPVKDIGLFRVSGVFPTISRDGSRLAFVDNEFKSVWLADGQGLRVLYQSKDPDIIFSPVWNQNPDKGILYVCIGPSFNAGRTLEIYAIPIFSSGRVLHPILLTKGRFNNAFPSSSPDGTKFVFRSTRDGGHMKHKNLYIMEKGDVGEYYGDSEVTRLTNGPWTDTHCQWSPNGDWIVFSSTRDKPASKWNEKDHGLDPGYFAVYLVKASDPTVVVRVIKSGSDLAGHVNHPVFSPDGRSIAVTADLAAVSADPISLPLFVHSVRPYGDIFVVDIDPTNIKKNKDVKAFRRVTHSRYENATPCWTLLSPDHPRALWAAILKRGLPPAASGCPFSSRGGESFHMTGHLIIPKRCC